MCPECEPVIEELREEIRQLRAELYGHQWEPPRELDLTFAQKAVLRALIRWDRVLPLWFLFNATRLVPGSHGDEIDPKVLQVQMSKMRRKLRPFGLEIETAHGEGYVLERASREKLLNWNAQMEAA